MTPMFPTLRLLLPFALAASIAAPTTAQNRVVAHGHGAYVAANQETHVASFAAVGNAHGSAYGFLFGTEPSTGAYLAVRIETHAVVNDLVVFAGTVIAAYNAPFVSGGNVFFAIRDGRPDAFAGVSTVPPQFAPMTAAQIVALIGPPPPAALSPLLWGNFVVR